ncbi:hypothetical protein CRG98_017397 [Punica granatum]|uniref:Uncharacterized protein n=1 Tax=Punica granatum TaxID=22663 RepID=A0A2I0K0X6_PUNGR|nr:hypothetical protein CRG98_017397 [Punica granatum]
MPDGGLKSKKSQDRMPSSEGERRSPRETRWKEEDGEAERSCWPTSLRHAAGRQETGSCCREKKTKKEWRRLTVMGQIAYVKIMERLMMALNQVGKVIRAGEAELRTRARRGWASLFVA